MARLLMISGLLAALSLPAQSVAAEGSGSGTADIGVTSAEAARAEQFIRAKHNKVRQVLRKPDTPQRAIELTDLLGEFLDYDHLAKLSLDTEWDRRTPRERELFVNLLRQLVERQYQHNMESTLDYKVKWVGTESIDEGVKVKSSARSTTKKRQPPIDIDYSMALTGKRWKVFDIFTDEVSLVVNYKRQFRRVIKDEGWNGLIERMQKKLKAEDDVL